MNSPPYAILGSGFLHRPVGRLGLALLVVAICTAPAVLFFDPAPWWPVGSHVAREPLSFYRLFSDDVAYVASARNWQRTVSNLFVPHNTHVVPAWRLLTWALTAWAGNLARVPEVLAIASYSILVAVMLMIGRLVARETGRTALGLAAMILVGTTSLMFAPATWYSAGQPLWAGLGILATLWYAQSYRRTGRMPALVGALFSAPLAGWFWTVGHLAGPVAAVYLWVDGSRRCRIAAAVPLTATAIAVGLSLGIASHRIAKTISFHGRTVQAAFTPARGLVHTLQAIPENLVFGNLGLAVQSTQAQGAVLTLALVALWLGSSWLKRDDSGQKERRSGEPRETRASGWNINPLECAGAALVVGSYLIEWTFRGYLDFRYLRTLNMRAVVPWYDLIPQIGAVLFAVGWWSRIWPVATQPGHVLKARSLTTLECLGLGVMVVILIVLHRPRVEALLRMSTAPLLPSEQRRFPISRLQTLRANVVLLNQSEWQRSALRRLDHAEEIARRMGLGQDAIRAAFGHTYVPGTVGRLLPELYDLYDTAALLDLPEHGRPVDPTTVRRALADFINEVKEPRPQWIDANESWPPEDPTGIPK